MRHKTHYTQKGILPKERIEGLSRSGLISSVLAESLKIHKFLGDKALHLLEIPAKDELKAAIHLLELTLETVFDVPSRHQKLKEILIQRLANK